MDEINVQNPQGENGAAPVVPQEETKKPEEALVETPAVETPMPEAPQA